MTTSPIPVLFCTDDKYWQHLGATLASLLASNLRHQFRVMICSIQKDPENEARIFQIADSFGNAAVEFIRFTPNRSESLPISGHITLGAYLRLFMAEYLDATLEKLLYLDCDLVVRKDIGPLWMAEVDSFVAAAVLEPYIEGHQSEGFGRDDLYFNSGVLLINLARWRSENLLPKFIACAKQKYSVLRYWDQDILNSVLRGQVAFLNPRWNFHPIHAEMLPVHLGLTREEYQEIRRDPAIVHFTTKAKPWYYFPEPQYKRYYWEALSLTPWKGASPLGRTPSSVVRKALKMKRLKQLVRLHGAQSMYLLSQLVGRRVLWSHVTPPPNHPTLA